MFGTLGLACCAAAVWTVPMLGPLLWGLGFALFVGVAWGAAPAAEPAWRLDFFSESPVGPRADVRSSRG
jgi:hypothetical protein